MVDFCHRVQAAPPLPSDSETPAFARPTATLLVRQKLKDPRLLESGDTVQMMKEVLLDWSYSALTACIQALKAISDFDEQQRQARTQEPARFQPSVKNPALRSPSYAIEFNLKQSLSHSLPAEMPCITPVPQRQSSHSSLSVHPVSSANQMAYLSASTPAALSSSPSPLPQGPQTASTPVQFSPQPTPQPRGTQKKPDPARSDKATLQVAFTKVCVCALEL